MYSQLKEKYSNIKAMIKNLPQNTTAQKIAVDLLLAYGKPVSKIIENVLEHAVFESTPVDVNTEMEIKKIQLQTELVNAKTSLLFAEKEHMEMLQEKQELLQEQNKRKEEEALKQARLLVANADANTENEIG